MRTENAVRQPDGGGVRLPFKPLVDIERMPEGERWLVEGFLSNSGLAVLAATPKAGKTWVSLALGVAVASGTPALGRFHVPDPGRVMLYPAEDDVRAVRERIESLCLGQGLELAELPIDVITADRLQLDDAEQREQLEELLEVQRPKLLVLDPLVRLHSGTESCAAHMSELFGYLRALQRRFGVAILVTHHLAKNRSSGATQPGQAMRGSGDIHASYDHGAMLHRERDGRLVLSLEHRIAATPEPMAFRLVSHEGGATTFEEAELDVEEEVERPRPRRAAVRELRPRPRPTKVEQPVTEQVLGVLEQAGAPLSQVRIRKILKVRNETLTAALRTLQADGRVENLGRMGGWRVVGSTDSDSSAVEKDGS